MITYIIQRCYDAFSFEPWKLIYTNSYHTAERTGTYEEVVEYAKLLVKLHSYMSDEEVCVLTPSGRLNLNES